MEWIKVSDRLPVETNSKLGYSDEVLCFSKNNYVKFYISKYDHKEETWVYETYLDSYHNKITHWMPLPELPKDL